MQQFEPPQESAGNEPGSSPAHVDSPTVAASDAVPASPRRDVRGRTLDDALRQDRRVREGVLRQARQVVNGMRFCTSTRQVGLEISRRSWVPFLKFFNSLAPRSAEQCGIFILGLLCCFMPVIYMGSILLSIGIAGSTIGLTLWLVATVTRALLGAYLKNLIPW